MRLDKFTVKAQEALQAAQSLADREGHQALSILGQVDTAL